MFIFNKKTNTLINTELIKEIKVEYHIYRDGNITAIRCDSNRIAEYKTPERAQKVFSQIFEALKCDAKTFELPED